MNAEDVKGPAARPAAKVTLVSLYNTDNLSIRYMLPVLRNAGHRVQVVYFRDYFVNDATPHTPADEQLFLNAVREYGPDLVGFSIGASAFAPVARRLTELLREAGIGPVIWGGIHTMVTPDEAIEIADMVCLGEGEQPLLELTDALAAGRDPSAIRNLWLRTPGGLVKNPTRPYMQNLDELPMPDFDSRDTVFIQDGRHDVEPQSERTWQYFVQGARGCPYHCAFCMNSILKPISPGRFVRRRSVEHLIQELELVRRSLPRVGAICFVDEVFLLDPKWALEFAEAYRRRIALPFSIYNTPRDMTRELVAQLVQAGLFEIEIGIQSGSERVRREIFERNMTNEELRRAARIVHEYGVQAKYDLIFDNPFESEDDKREMLDLVLALPKPFEFCFFSMIWFPRVPVTQKALAAGLITESDIETVAKKSFRQWAVSFDYPRSRSEHFWVSIVSLTGKVWIPNGLIRRFSHSRLLQQHPVLLRPLIRLNTLILWGIKGVPVILKGELPWAMLRKRWRFMLKALK